MLFCFWFKRWSWWHGLIISAVLDATVCKFHTDYIIWEFLFSIWIGSFESRHFTLSIFLMSVRQRYTQSFVLKFTETAEICFILQKCFVIVSAQINVESLQIWKMYYSYLYDQKRRSILRANNHTDTSIYPAVSVLMFSFHSPHRHMNSTHFSVNIRLSGHVANTYIFQMRSHIWGRWMICERLDVLPDVLYYHIDQPLMICQSQNH